jgi:5-hydroxyisourate hydrolase-like protein (transthyretin family)
MKRIMVITSLIIILGGIISCKKIRHALIPTRIEGTVVDILNGEAIPNAEITLWEGKRDFNQPVATAQSDAEGKFKIKYKFKNNDDSDGQWRYSVSAKKEGYYKKSNSNKAEYDVNKEAIEEVEPTRANKNITLKLIPITKATIELEDMPPYYTFENTHNSLIIQYSHRQSGSFFGYIGVSKNSFVTTAVFDTIGAGPYSFNLYERDYGGSFIKKVKTFDVYIKPNQENNLKLDF